MSLGECVKTNAIRRDCGGCCQCARTESGHATAPLTSAMNFRRLTPDMELPPLVSECFLELAPCKPRSDVLRAVPVEGLEVKQEHPLNLASVARCRQSRSELGIVRDVLHLGMCEDLESAAVWVIHEEQSHAAVGAQIAHADVLTIAPEILKAERLLVQHAQKSGLSAAMLHVWPSGLRDGRHVKAIARLDESCLSGGEDVRSELTS